MDENRFVVEKRKMKLKDSRIIEIFVIYDKRKMEDTLSKDFFEERISKRCKFMNTKYYKHLRDY